MVVLGGSTGADCSPPSSETITFIGRDGEIHAVNQDGTNGRAITHPSEFTRSTGTRWFARLARIQGA